MYSHIAHTYLAPRSVYHTDERAHVPGRQHILHPRGEVGTRLRWRLHGPELSLLINSSFQSIPRCIKTGPSVENMPLGTGQSGSALHQLIYFRLMLFGARTEIDVSQGCDSPLERHAGAAIRTAEKICTHERLACKTRGPARPAAHHVEPLHHNEVCSAYVVHTTKLISLCMLRSARRVQHANVVVHMLAVDVDVETYRVNNTFPFIRVHLQLLAILGQGQGVLYNILEFLR